jgi:hypothetical protein
VVNHVSELIAYFYSFAMINKHGHLKILYVGLAANAVRFLYISLIPNAWFVLPIELLQGVLYASVRACMCERRSDTRNGVVGGVDVHIIGRTG